MKPKEAGLIMSAMADAFAEIEKKNRIIHEVVVGQKVLKAIKDSGNFEPKYRTVWGARVLFDRKAKGYKIALRSRLEMKRPPKVSPMMAKVVTLKLQGVA